MECNRVVHVKCLHISTQNYQCPLCKKSMTDMTHLWEQLDNYLLNSKMPEEYNNMRSNIFCNDCLSKSETKYHFFYHKCIDCNSWNTTVLNTFTIDD